jgi:hypothetical protein
MIFVRHSLKLARVEPHPTAMSAGLDLNAMIFAAGEIVTVLGAFHVMALTLGIDRGSMRALSLPPQQLGIFSGEILVFVATWLILLH